MSPPDVAAAGSDPLDHLQAMVSERDRQLAELSEAHDRAMAQLRQELERKHAEDMDGLSRQHAQALKQARLELSLQEDGRCAKSRADFMSLVSGFLDEAFILTDASGKVILSNDKVLEFTGLTAQELVSEYGHQFRASNADGTQILLKDLPLAKALDNQVTRATELTFHLKDRNVTLLANAGPVRGEAGELRGGIVVFQDISRRMWAERRTDLLNDLSELLSGGMLEQAQWSQIARLVGEVLGAWSVVGLRRPFNDQLDLIATYHPDPECATYLADISNQIAVVIGMDPGMGLVAVTGRPILRAELPSLDHLEHLDPRVAGLFERMGSESLLILPLIARGNTLGVLMLVSMPHRPRFTQEDLEYSTQLVDRIAATFDSVQLLNDVRNKERRVRMVAELSRQFATSLDLQQVLRTVAAQVTEALGDWCTIGLLDERGEIIRPAAVYHRDAGHHAALQRLAESYPVSVGDGISGRVVASQTPVMFENLTEEDLRATARNQESLDMLLWLRPSNYICVPLSVRGKPLGYLDLACGPESGRKLDESAMSLVQELADRAANAIQNAQLYEELQGVIRAKDDWLSVASHELKTPLTPLQVLLQLMDRRIRRGEQVTGDQINRCLTQVSRIIRLINDLLDVSKIELGQLELHPELVEVRPLIEDVVNSFRDSSEVHQIELRPGGEGLTIAADRGRIEQVVVNLVHNAIKYSPEGGPVSVEIRRDESPAGPRALIIVEDRGIGIPEHEQPRLFQRYFRGSNVPERNFGGLGLGLWISHEIVDRHNGQLWAESNPGEGTRFMASLPLASSPELPARDERPLVLIVDDDEAILETAAECLREEGYQVEVARNGQAAMGLLARRRPNVVLMDLMMPLMDGWELMRRLRALPDGQQIKVIVVSAAQDLSDRATEVGAWDFLVKPFNLEEMLRKLARAVGRGEDA